VRLDFELPAKTAATTDAFAHAGRRVLVYDQGWPFPPGGVRHQDGVVNWRVRGPRAPRWRPKRELRAVGRAYLPPC